MIEGADFVSRSDVPELNGVFPARGGQTFRVARKGNGANLGRFAAKGAKLPARGGFPQTGAVIATADKQFAVLAQSESRDAAPVGACMPNLGNEYGKRELGLLRLIQDLRWAVRW